MASVDWTRVSSLFDQALDQPAAERLAWLALECDDEATRAEVQALLRSYEQEPDFLEQPADAAAAVQALDARGPQSDQDRHIGPYRLVRELGRGGMGVVYEAADTRFERRVAVKVLPAAWAAPALSARFQFERQVLASLDHPNIARLLDGGTTEDGVPYFVMELVEGERIDVWADARSMDLRARVRLLLTVCDAVAHAHHQLIVHRDLKPANILITADGRPKLLDFGIATLVSDVTGASAGHTRTGQSSFTPEYASPEQARGERVTVASDVYSLGVLAYRLLTGRPPYDLAALSPFDAARTICDLDPPAPSRAAPSRGDGLRGDLDAILLKALRKNPRERYPSVTDLARDLTAWLEGRVVAATPASTTYAVRKFVARHRLPLAAISAVVLALGAGAITTAWQARLTRQALATAENRFRDVREFSRSLLFEVHDSLRTLPGATEPRRLLLARAVQFLDRLAADAGNDEALKLELAEGYRRLGQVQGSQLSENLGDVSAATASFEKAVALAEDVLSRRTARFEAADVATGAYDDLSSVLLAQGQVDAAERAYGRHAALVDQMERRFGAHPEARYSIGSSLVNLGLFRASRRDLAGAQQLYERAIDTFLTLPEEVRSGDKVLTRQAFALKRLGAVLLANGHVDAAEGRYRAALAIDEVLVSRHPEDARMRYDMTFSLADLGVAASRRGDDAEAIQLWNRALAIREAALQADPRNVRTMLGVASLHANLGNAARARREPERAVQHWRAAVAAREALVTQQGGLPSARVQRAESQTHLAGCLLDLAAARPAAQRAALVAEARALLTTASSDAAPLIAHNPLAKAIAGQITLDRARADRF